MRITFICGSLEPGRDGVGDYCVTLATALREAGVTASFLALADRFISVPTSPSPNVFRIPLDQPRLKRYELARSALMKWLPDWVSLQFVSWNFGWKGVVAAEGNDLRLLLRDRPLHIMFHETWLGSNGPEMLASRVQEYRRRILGGLQRYSISRLGRQLAPALIHTSNAAYSSQLNRIGVKARQLLMFGSIPFVVSMDWQKFRGLVETAGGLDLGPQPDEIVIVGIFGTVKESHVDRALTDITGAAGSRRCVLLSIGHAGSAGRALLAELIERHPKFELALLGPQDTKTLSLCFQHLDVAISMNPTSLIGKSSAAAALLEHGVAVISPWGPLPSDDDVFVRRWRHLLCGEGEDVSRLLQKRAPFVPPVSSSRLAAKQLLAEMAAINQRDVDPDFGLLA